MTFAEQLRYIMTVDSLTQAEVAAKSGFTRAAISYYLSEKRVPDVNSANHILKSLGWNMSHPYKIGLDMTTAITDDGVNLKKNGSGYSDPTAAKAIQKVDKDRERLMKLLDVIFTVCDYAGFHVEERIVLKDKKTGKIWR